MPFKICFWVSHVIRHMGHPHHIHTNAEQQLGGTRVSSDQGQVHPKRWGLTICPSYVSTNHITTLRIHWSLGAPFYKEGPEAQRG